MKFHKLFKQLGIAIILVALAQTGGYAIDDIWGGFGIAEDAAKPKNSDSGNKYPANLTPSRINQDLQATNDTDHRTIKGIEFYGLNSVSQEELLEKIQMKEGGTYSKEILQADLRTIYETGYFTEKMKAIPSRNDDGSVTVKIVVEENIPVKDFTIEGNSVISIEDILAQLEEMKGKPQNIAKLNEAIAKIQDLYNAKRLYSLSN